MPGRYTAPFDMPARIQHVLAIAALACAVLPVTAHAAVNCEAIQRVAALEAKPVANAPAALHAAGSDRIQFYSALHGDCAMPGIFILPSEAVTAHASIRGFTSVTYT